MLKTRFLPEIDFSGFFWVTDYDSAVGIEKFLIAIWQIQDGGPKLWVKILKMLKMRFLPEIDYSGVFQVTDYESAVRIEKFLIAIWWTTSLEGKIDPKE